MIYVYVICFYVYSFFINVLLWCIKYISAAKEYSNIRSTGI